VSKLTVTYKIKATKKRKPEKKPDTPPPVEQPGTGPVSRAAWMLALAHHVERLVEDGSVKSYADAARQLGITRGRMTQVLNLLTLPPRVQEGLLLGDLHLSERRMRALVMNPQWTTTVTVQERQEARPIPGPPIPSHG
jgi:hypothetical protein